MRWHSVGLEILHTREAHLIVALALGLLVGTERERRREAQGAAGFAGLRTFALVSLLGGLVAYLDVTALMVTGAIAVSAFAIAGYAITHDDDDDRGITTEVALVVTYVLGMLAITSPLLAPAVAVVMTWILALRGELHQLVRNTLTESELRSILILLLFALVLVPVAPDEPFGPYGAVNPQSLLRLVVVLMTITSAGYVAQRVLSPKLGLVLSGLASGFVSSSATIAAMGMRARQEPSHWRAAAAGALASSIATVVQYVVVIAAVHTSLIRAIAPNLIFASMAAVLCTGALWLSMRGASGSDSDRMSQPFHVWMALGFGAVFVLVTIASSALQERIGSAGIVLVSGVASIVGAHSTAGSVAALHRTQSVDVETARIAILTALSSNTLTKIALAFTGRHMAYALSVSLGVVVIAAAAWAALLFM